MISLILLGLAIGCRAIGELALHGKLKWANSDAWGDKDFWGDGSWLRKYKFHKGGVTAGSKSGLVPAPDNLYYRFFNIEYKERWPTSATFTVMFTDGPHLMQFFFFLFISLSIGMALGLNWWLIAVVWLLVHLCHWAVYRLLQK